MTRRPHGLSRRGLLGGALTGLTGLAGLAAPRVWGTTTSVTTGSGAGTGSGSGTTPLLRKEFIDEHATTPQVHASTLVELTDGSLLAAWFGGTAERAPDVRIWCSHLKGGAWSAPRAVASGVQPDGTPLPTWNPVLFQASPAHGGKLLLFYKVGPSPQQWWGELITSDDGGRRWSLPRRLPEGVLGPIRSKPLMLPDGTLLCPSSTEDAEGTWRLHFERSRDLGLTWLPNARVSDLRGYGLIQPSLVARPDGSLLAFARSRADRIAMTRSRDGGRCWSAPTLTTLPNPNAGIEALGLQDGRILMVFNPREQGRDWWIGRDRLDLALSDDGGRTWRTVANLEDEPGQEFSYPAAIQTRDGGVHLTYTYKRSQIRHVQLDPRRLD